MTILSSRALIGVVHLPPLPGSPRFEGSVEAVAERALADATALHECGFDALILENLGDAPFTADRLPPASVACMALIADRLRRALPIPMGINALRNDAMAALGIAAAAGASFIRVNVLTGVVATDQGFLQGRADKVLRYRRLLGSHVAILADVFVKHGLTLHASDIAAAARDTAYRGLADGLLVTGPATGAPTDMRELERVKQAVPDRPLFVGSGATPAAAPELLKVANGIIVGSALKPGGDLRQPIDRGLAATFVAAARA